jgi:hypothetical protein
MNKNDKEFLNKLLENHNPKSDGISKAKEWKKKFKEDLIDFTYIHTIDEFIKLGLGGVMKIITLSNEDLKKGGILVKISKDIKNNKWFALLSIPKKRYIWKVYFDTNYIFYRVPYNVYISDD